MYLSIHFMFTGSPNVTDAELKVRNPQSISYIVDLKSFGVKKL